MGQPKRPTRAVSKALTGPSKLGIETLKATIVMAVTLLCSTITLFTEKGLGTNWFSVMLSLAPTLRKVYSDAVAIPWVEFSPELRDIQIRELLELARATLAAADCLPPGVVELLTDWLDWIEETVTVGTNQFTSGKDLVERTAAFFAQA